MELNDTIQAEPFSILPDISTSACGSTVANINIAKTDGNSDGTNSSDSRLKQLHSCSSPECSRSMKGFETIKEGIQRSNSTPCTYSSDADVAFGNSVGSLLATIKNSPRKEALKIYLMKAVAMTKCRDMSEKYTIIKLENGIRLVPTCWLTEDESHSYWPNYSSSSKINSIVEKLTEPDKKSWQLHKVSRIFGTSYDYTVGLEKMKQWVTDVNIARSDGAGSQRKRHRCQKDSSSDETEIEDETSNQDIYILPKPPPKKIPLLDCFSDSSEESDTLAESSADMSSGRKIPVKRASVNNNSVLPLKTSTKTQDKIPNENVKDFMEVVVQEPNSISSGLKILEDPASLSMTKAMEKEYAYVTPHFMTIFPIKTDKMLGYLETFLSAEDQNKKYVVTVLKAFGGSGDDQLITNILKRCISDRVAELYSWVGAEQKKAFKPLIFSSVIFQCVQHHSQTITEETYGAAVSSWLRHAKQRIEQKLNPVTSNG